MTSKSVVMYLKNFILNLENAMMSKAGSDKKTYHVGDEVPAVGDSFQISRIFLMFFL